MNHSVILKNKHTSFSLLCHVNHSVKLYVKYYN